MPIPGQEILRRITEFAATAGAAEQDARKAAEQTSSEIDRLVTSQSEAFRELAQLYLPQLEDDVVRDGWSEMQSTLHNILLRKDDARRQLSGRLKQVTDQRIALEGRWEELCDRVNELTLQCDQLATQLSGQLGHDREFQTLSTQAAEGQARLEQAQANLEEVEKDAQEKLPNYERGRLFQYMHESGFGTEAYTKRGLTRRLDRWVSRMIDYPRAAAGYKFLTLAPVQMRQLIDEQKAAVKTVMEEVERRQTAAATSLGLPALQAEGSKVRKEQEAIAPQVENARKSEELARRQLAELDSPDSPFYRDALKTFQQLIQNTERSIVAARAANTPEMTDDQVVARLKHIDEQVDEKKHQLDNFFSAAEQAARRTSRINELASKCRRAQFDHPRRLFADGFDLESQLTALLAGTVDADHVYREMYRSQHLDSPVADKAASALQSPMAQILLSTMAQAAGAALGAYATRAGQQHRVRGQNKDWF